MRHRIATKGDAILFAERLDDPTSPGWIKDGRTGRTVKIRGSVGSMLARGYWKLEDAKQERMKGS